VMAKQGDRDRPNPRRCQSEKLANVMGRRSSDSIRARGKQYAASRGRIDDCKPSLLLTIKTTCNQGGVHRCQCQMRITRANCDAAQKKLLRSAAANGDRGGLDFQVNQSLQLIASDRPFHDCSANDKRRRADQAKLFGKLTVSANSVVEIF